MLTTLLTTYTKSIHSNKSLSDTLTLLSEGEFYLNGYKYIKVEPKEPAANRLIFTPKSESLMCYNSFVPVTEIVAEEDVLSTKLTLHFALKRNVKDLICAILTFEIVLQLAFLILLFTQSFSDWVFAFIPLLMIIYSCLLSFLALRVTSKQLIRQIQVLLA